MIGCKRTTADLMDEHNACELFLEKSNEKPSIKITINNKDDVNDDELTKKKLMTMMF